MHNASGGEDEEESSPSSSQSSCGSSRSEGSSTRSWRVDFWGLAGESGFVTRDEVELGKRE
jgi:hypothetical protein